MFLLISGLTTDIYSQVTVQEEETDTLDFSISQKELDFSSVLAVSSTLILPGVSHYYMGRKRRAFFYTVLDAAVIAGFAATYSASDQIEMNSRAYAARHADVSGTHDERYWNMVSNFMTSDVYNTEMELTRNNDEKYTEASLSWEWESERQLEHYSELRKKSEEFRSASYFCLATLLVNRVISFFDTRNFIKNKRHSMQSNTGISASFSSNSLEVSLFGRF